MLKIENIKISPDQTMGAVAAETARLLKIREKDFQSLRILRRSVDARDGVSLVYTVEVAVKDDVSDTAGFHADPCFQQTSGPLLLAGETVFGGFSVVPFPGSVLLIGKLFGHFYSFILLNTLRNQTLCVIIF